jgi:lipoate-protein ligase A
MLPGVDRLAVVLDVGRPTEPDRRGWPAAVDAAVGGALLRHVANSSSLGTGWLRLYRPAPTVGFSTRDSRAPGFIAASTAASAGGFAPLVRAPGGHAAAYHRSCLCFDLVIPDPSGCVDVVAQLEHWGQLLTAVLRTFGADAVLGPLPDEYCPGRFSVHAAGVKLVGTAGRRRPGAALVGGVIVVDDAEPLRVVIDAVYTALGLPCDLSTVGSLADALGRRELSLVEVPDTAVTVPMVADALLAALETTVPLELLPLPDPVVAIALDAAPGEPAGAVLAEGESCA